MSRFFYTAIALILSVASLRAHDPFDHSSRIIVRENDIRVTVTLGYDAARSFLIAAGLSTSEMTRLTRDNTRGSMTNYAAVTLHMFELRVAGGEPLAAQGLDVISTGMETRLIATYPRPPSGLLEARALYFNGIEDIRQGTMVAADEAGNLLNSSLLSRANDSMPVTLPLGGTRAETMTAASAKSLPSLSEKPDALPQAPDSQPTRVSIQETASQKSRPSFGEFFKLGIEHILLGFDHLLFLAALLIGVRKLRPMLVIITCFTLAHSVTLALAGLELVTVSSRIIEPLIALSIIVVAVDNLVRRDASADRYWLAGGFGLIHGFGFASVLRETGLAQAGQSFLMPLFSFNLGVEFGQLAVLSVFAPALLALRRWPVFLRYEMPAVSALVIALGGYWFLQRTLW